MNYHSEKDTSASSSITASWQRLRDQAYWLLTMSIGTAHGSGAGGNVFAAYPQAYCVVDDFGTLVCVSRFR